jgi:hypothetical protein
MTAINVESTDFQTEDRSWLASDYGTDEPRTVTLDVSAFTSGTHYPNGYIPSGIVLGKITATGLYGPYSNAASDGREVASGHLFSSVKVPNTAVTTIDVGGALMEMGIVVEAKLPSGHGLDSAGKTDLAGWFKYV